MPTLVITGAGRGLGREFAERYAAAGWTVIATARSQADLAALSALAGVEALALDVTDDDAANRLLAAVGERPVDLFIANAGILDHGAPTRERWLESLDVNTVAPTLLALALADRVAASEGRRIAVLTSKMGSIADNGSGGSIIYRSTKAAVNAAFRSLSLDLAPRGISVVLLHPGWVRTDMGGPSGLIDAATSVAGMIDEIAATTPANSGRFVDYAGKAIPW